MLGIALGTTGLAAAIVCTVVVSRVGFVAGTSSCPAAAGFDDGID
jgi:hypothetical protein